MDWTNLQAVVTWVVGAGSPALVMYAVSWLIENWKGWATLPFAVKFLAPMLLSVLLSFGASMLLRYPELIAAIQPWFQIVAAAILAWLASQSAYMKALREGYGKRFSE